MVKKFILLSAIFLVALLAIQCKHDPFGAPGLPNPSDPGDTISGNPCQPGVIYFEKDVMPILRSNCAMSGCHDAGTHEEGVVLDSYDNVMRTGDVRAGKPSNSDLYEVLVKTDPEERMPYQMPKLPAEQIDIIKKWIEQGAKNLTCDDQANCDTANMSYQNDIKPILQANCLGCHTGSRLTPYDLSVYAGVQSVAANNKLYGAISHASGYRPMPDGPNNPSLSQCQINKIKSWVDAGSKNN